jgi:hypothetical protein
MSWLAHSVPYEFGRSFRSDSGLIGESPVFEQIQGKQGCPFAAD